MAEAEANLDTENVETETTPDTGEPAADAGGPDYAKQIQGLESALSAEREKYRQELGQYRRELDYVRGAIEGRGQPEKKQQERKPVLNSEDEFWTDIPGAIQRAADAGAELGYKRAVEHFGQREAARVDAQAKEFMSEHQDYLEAETAYLQAAQMRPSMIQDLHHTTNPAKYVYSWWQKSKTTETGDVAALQAKIAELEAKLGGGEVPGGPKPPKTQAGKRQSGPSSAASGDDPFRGPLDD